MGDTQFLLFRGAIKIRSLKIAHALRKAGVDKNDFRIIVNLYLGQNMAI